MEVHTLELIELLISEMPFLKLEFRKINVVRRQPGSKQRCTNDKCNATNKEEKWEEYNDDIRCGYEHPKLHNQYEETSHRKNYDWDKAYAEYLSVKPRITSKYQEIPDCHSPQERDYELYRHANGRYHVFFDSEYWCFQCENSGYKRIFYGRPNIVFECKYYN